MPGFERYILNSTINGEPGVPQGYAAKWALDASGDSIALAVEIGQPGVLDVAQDPEYLAICISMDDGVSFEMQQRFEFTGGAEAIDAALIKTESSL